VRVPIPILVGAAGGVLVAREYRARRAAERFAAAALETLLNAIDANDPETGAHVRRVASYALVLAEAAELDDRARRSVERVALFHDIGKIDSALFDIIHESSELTPEERQAIATHPARGADVLAPLTPFYPDLAEGVLAHHERWDGSGYPRGLRGARIPLAARVVAIADTFDAITHRRRYRRGQHPAAAVEALERGRGTQFDPELVDLFLLPPILAEAIELMCAAHEPPPAPVERRHGEREPNTPDVTFRWRTAALEPPPPGPTSPEPRG
jgi:HD-GYP domain-containing protein (c-di-GMP phosphodiesterase class II)